MDDTLNTTVLWNRLQATADEMYDACERLAFSASIREGADASAAIMTAEGAAIGLSSQSVPVLSGALARTARLVLADHYPPEALSPGDSILTNDPWLGGGHLSDIVVLRPVFSGETLVAVVGALGHVDDIGGLVGGWSTEAAEVYEEGLLVPPTKLYESGERNNAVVELVRSNVRLPDQVTGDLEALRSANSVGADRVRSLIEEQGIERYEHTTREVLDRSEEALAEEIAAVPDGTYEDRATFSFADTEVTVSTTVTVDGRTLSVDYDGSSDEVTAGINCPFGNVRSVTEYVIKCMLLPDLPNTEGYFRPLEISAPDGSILNCTRPSPTMARHLTYSRVEDTLSKALGEAVPEAAISGIGGGQIQTFSGEEFFANGWTVSAFPARADSDGHTAVIFPYNGKTVPAEILEQYSPVRQEESSIVPDSEGAGEYRSGFAHRAVYHNPTEDGINVTVTSEKVDDRPEGFGDGLPGVSCRASSSVDDKTVPLNGSGRMEPGERLVFTSSTPGGYGDPERRDPELVERDLRLGYITEQRAREVYDHSVE